MDLKIPSEILQFLLLSFKGLDILILKFVGVTTLAQGFVWYHLHNCIFCQTSETVVVLYVVVMQAMLWFSCPSDNHQEEVGCQKPKCALLCLGSKGPMGMFLIKDPWGFQQECYLIYLTFLWSTTTWRINVEWLEILRMCVLNSKYPTNKIPIPELCYRSNERGGCTIFLAKPSTE